MAYKIYQKLQSGMANQGLLDAADVDVLEDGQRVTLAEKLSGLSEDVAGMAENVSDAVAVADGIKTAQGQEVGDVAETDIAEGVLIWHGGRLYRVLSLIAAGDRWQDMDVTETTVSEEINAMRGVSTEGVYLTITPASAIPVEGVKARIYNEASQTYLPEVTFTPASPRHLLGQIAYGDVYTIIMPSIDGYTQPADQTFQANQMLRDRTVNYIPTSESTEESLIIKATKSNNGAIGDAEAIIKLYDGNGSITQTINVSIEGGTSEAVNIPLGTKYSVQYPSISGFVTPSTQLFTARTNTRTCYGTYVALLGSSYKWVFFDGQQISYIDLDQDLSSNFDDEHLIGVAFVTSSLLQQQAEFIYHFTISDNRSSVWASATVDAPSAINTWKGRENSASALDAILNYEIDNSVTLTSIFKVANSINTGFEENGQAIKPFVPAYDQYVQGIAATSNINTILTRYGSSKKVNMGDNHGLSEQTSISMHRARNYGTSQSNNKTRAINFNLLLPLLNTNVTTT